MTLWAIEFTPPRRLKLRLPFQAFAFIPRFSGQAVAMRIFRDHRILSQICGNNFNGIEDCGTMDSRGRHLGRYMEAIAQVVEPMHTSMWSEALQLAGR